MLSEWSYKHHLLIEVETVSGPRTESVIFIFARVKWLIFEADHVSPYESGVWGV